MTASNDFEEIGHSGGKVTFKIRIDDEQRLTYQLRYEHSRPNAAAVLAVYALPQGVAVGDIHMGGIGTPWNPPPIPGCFPVLIGSDSEGMFGRECPACGGYFRARHLAAVCAYCGYQGTGFYEFLTEAQRKYVSEYCHLLEDVLHSGEAGDHTIDMDAVADAVHQEVERPAFYYAEERQQNLFTCSACRGVNDVLGTYAYCSRCGVRNDLDELRRFLDGIRDSINAGGSLEGAVRDAVSGFDSFAAHMCGELVRRVPMTTARRSRFQRARYHNLNAVAGIVSDTFGCDILAGMSEEEQALLSLMFHRRHVYEHRGGEADEKYIRDSGDTVRLKQALRET